MLNYNQVLKVQKAHGYGDMQKMISSGHVWSMEGSAGREAMSCLESGACMLPLTPARDYYGNRIPSRKEIKEGSKGSFKNCQAFWTGVDEGRIFLDISDDDYQDDED